MTGKEKCKILKEIRNKIAQENGIDFVASECTFEGECAGHCPQCDSEALFLENALKKHGKLGTEEESAFSEFLYRQELIEKIMELRLGQIPAKPLPINEFGEFIDKVANEELMGDIIPDDFNEW